MDVSTSAATIRPAHHHHHDPPISAPSSPHSSSQYSPSTSISSLPSVSSSFFFSSAAASPPHSAPHSDHGQVDLGTHGLIIPSLALPAALRPPTVYGKTLGELRLLVLAGSNRNVIEEEFFTRLLSEDNADVVDVGGWEGVEYGRVVRASTDWVEHQDGFGIEKFEPTRNIEVVDLGGYEQDANADGLLTRLKSIIHAPFYAISDVLEPTHRPSPVVASLVSASSTPLYTALILLTSPIPSPLDIRIIDALGPDIPIVILPHTPLQSQAQTSTSPPPSPTYAHLKLSSFRPSTLPALRSGLFRSPETVSVLRSEAADRFLRWREVERAVDAVHTARRESVYGYMRLPQDITDSTHEPDHGGDESDENRVWNEKKWESEWAPQMSRDVARRLRENTITERSRPPPPPFLGLLSPSRSSARRRRPRRAQDVNPNPNSRTTTPAHVSPTPTLAFDPLHLPSLLLFSLSLLGPLRVRIASSVMAGVERIGSCVGLGGRSGSRGATARSDEDSMGGRDGVEREGGEEGWVAEREEEEGDKEEKAVSDWSVQAALVGGFCVGVGVGVFLGGWVGDTRGR